MTLHWTGDVVHVHIFSKVQKKKKVQNQSNVIFQGWLLYLLGMSNMGPSNSPPSLIANHEFKWAINPSWTNFLSSAQVFYTFSSFFLVAHAPLVSDGAAFGQRNLFVSLSLLKNQFSQFMIFIDFSLSTFSLPESILLDS